MEASRTERFNFWRPRPNQPWHRLDSKAMTRFYQLVLSECMMRVCYSICEWGVFINPLHYCLLAGKRDPSSILPAIITVASAVITSAYQLSFSGEQNRNRKLQRWLRLFHRLPVKLGRGQDLEMNERRLISTVTARNVLMKPTFCRLLWTNFELSECFIHNLAY